MHIRELNLYQKFTKNPTFGTAPSMTIKENMAMAENKGKSFGLRLGIKKGF